MRPVALTTLLIIGLVLVLPAIISVGIRVIPENIQPSLEKTQKIHDLGEVTQPFIAKEDGLSAIGVSLKNPNLANKKDIILEVSQPGGQVLRKAVQSGSVIQDGKFVRFNFPPVADSKNKQYQLRLLAPTVKKHEALEVFLTGDKNFLPAQITEDGKQVLEPATTSSATSYVIFHQPKSITALIGSIYSQWWSRLWLDWPFAITYLLLLAGGVIYLGWNRMHLK